ncbi:hypothetical protein HMPREF0204_14794 [Chryseobacterium gleum ATCC 35910]|uniref:Uncharacterized protein n=1 Tax=Chryseobacterium gleum ATCC 35910 TaxID=525257 RepID=A0ABN0ARN2_CHRGE|nr:hypothetical protein HMPREF0204_14794 [Chryseobacterium gleum ATCC 35910]
MLLDGIPESCIDFNQFWLNAIHPAILKNCFPEDYLSHRLS